MILDKGNMEWIGKDGTDDLGMFEQNRNYNGITWVNRGRGTTTGTISEAIIKDEYEYRWKEAHEDD